MIPPNKLAMKLSPLDFAYYSRLPSHTFITDTSCIITKSYLALHKKKGLSYTRTFFKDNMKHHLGFFHQVNGYKPITK